MLTSPQYSVKNPFCKAELVSIALIRLNEINVVKDKRLLFSEKEDDEQETYSGKTDMSKIGDIRCILTSKRVTKYPLII